ncbi:DNA polymerase III subunit delta, partial [Candidatus Pelagibacter sp.]|nr:DNA polymerase III subunit delta [Candidatus Pelagibacter sp.]
KKIKISTENINLIIEKTNGNRLLLKNELEKIFLYSERNKDLTTANIKKLIKNFDNIGISNLTDNFLVKNKKKTLNLLNENTLSLEDNISVIRNCLQQLKKLRTLKKELLTTKSIDEVLSKYRPTIFWKDKEVVKQQLKIWSLKNIETSIKKISNIELSIKKNAQVSKQIFNNYVLENLS